MRLIISRLHAGVHYEGGSCRFGSDKALNINILARDGEEFVIGLAEVKEYFKAVPEPSL